jgi:CubicO group peptidase (beta-lactamase class C family)
MHRTTIVSAITASLSIAALGAPGDACPSKGTGTLQQIVTDWVRQNQPGVAHGLCAVALNSKGAEGFACAGQSGNGNGLNRDTLFQIGSLTKTFTAGLFARRLVDGSYTTHSLLDPHLPSKYRLGAVDTTTLLQLATHHSGLPRIPPSYDGATGDWKWFDIEAPILSLAGPHGYLYSNWAFQLLGYTIAFDDQLDWETDIHWEFLDPFEMAATGTQAYLEAFGDYFDDNAAHKYTADGDDIGTDPADSCPTADPSGCLYSSPHDMRIWLQYNMNQLVGAEDDPALTYLRTDYDSGSSSSTTQGLAWAFEHTSCDALPKPPASGQKVYTSVAKSGDVDGSHAYIVYLQDPSHRTAKAPLGVVLMVNSDLNGPNKLNDLANDLLSRLPMP